MLKNILIFSIIVMSFACGNNRKLSDREYRKTSTGGGFEPSTADSGFYPVSEGGRDVLDEGLFQVQEVQ